VARNPIQMQEGMSLSELNARYGTQQQCEAAIAVWRWPDGFVCRCGSRDYAIVGKRRLYLCHDCLTQTSLKAGTVFARTLVPLTKWFQGMYLPTQSKNSISTLELVRQQPARSIAWACLAPRSRTAAGTALRIAARFPGTRILAPEHPVRLLSARPRTMRCT
jgi:hypothetical protein